jgi:hypothetical protein
MAGMPLLDVHNFLEGPRQKSKTHWHAFVCTVIYTRKKNMARCSVSAMATDVMVRY